MGSDYTWSSFKETIWARQCRGGGGRRGGGGGMGRCTLRIWGDGDGGEGSDEGRSGGEKDPTSEVYVHL